MTDNLLSSKQGWNCHRVQVSTALWKCMREWTIAYLYTLNGTRWLGQLHAPAALPLEGATVIPTEYDATACTLWRRPSCRTLTELLRETKLQLLCRTGVRRFDGKGRNPLLWSDSRVAREKKNINWYLLPPKLLWNCCIIYIIYKCGRWPHAAHGPWVGDPYFIPPAYTIKYVISEAYISLNMIFTIQAAAVDYSKRQMRS
jgi:hypothetical protein